MFCNAPDLQIGSCAAPESIDWKAWNKSKNESTGTHVCLSWAYPMSSSRNETKLCLSELIPRVTEDIYQVLSIVILSSNPFDGKRGPGGGHFWVVTIR